MTIHYPDYYLEVKECQYYYSPCWEKWYVLSVTKDKIFLTPNNGIALKEYDSIDEMLNDFVVPDLTERILFWPKGAM